MGSVRFLFPLPSLSPLIFPSSIYRPAINENKDSTTKVETAVLAPRNSIFESGDWLNSIIWDENSNYKDFTKVELNLNDVRMNLEIVKPVIKVLPPVEGKLSFFSFSFLITQTKY